MNEFAVQKVQLCITFNVFTLCWKHEAGRNNGTMVTHVLYNLSHKTAKLFTVAYQVNITHCFWISSFLLLQQCVFENSDAQLHRCWSFPILSVRQRCYLGTLSLCLVDFFFLYLFIFFVLTILLTLKLWSKLSLIETQCEACNRLPVFFR